MTWLADVLCAGAAEGQALRLDAPISFWGGICPQTSRIILPGHPQFGETLCDRMIVLPELIGSSSSSAVMLELIYRGKAPRALILGQRDAILPIGVVVARQMGWPAPPVCVVDDPVFRTGERLRLSRDGTVQRSD